MQYSEVMNLQRFVRRSLVSMTFVLPLSLTFGRGVFGVGGWDMLGYFYLFSPMLIIFMLVVGFLVSGRADVKATRMVSRQDALLISAFYVTVLVHAFFAVGFGDTDESIKSVATVLFGRGLLDFSRIMAELTFWVAGALMPIILYVAIAERFKSRAER